MVPETAITGKTDLERLLVEGDNGRQYFLSDFAEVVRAVGPVEIVREDQVKEVIVRANADGISVGEANRRAEAAVQSSEIPSGISYEMGGQAQMMADMKRTALLVAVFAIFFAFVVLAVQFESLKLPAVIILSVPLCLAGIVFGLYTAGSAIGSTVLIGLLIVVYAVVNDGVVLLSFAEELRVSEKQPVHDAILNAAGIRLRPMVMTTLSTIAGFAPLALNLGEGADLLVPMAVGAIGGLIFEIFVVLFFTPCLYLVISRH
jgi:multidrug efflux pump subunit AcrB